MTSVTQKLLLLLHCFVAAAAIHNFDVCCGIELLDELHKGAVDVSTVYDAKVRRDLMRIMNKLLFKVC
jgi:hypothetical protein